MLDKNALVSCDTTTYTVALPPVVVAEARTAHHCRCGDRAAAKPNAHPNRLVALESRFGWYRS
jgi:hypothetical protein